MTPGAQPAAVFDVDGTVSDTNSTSSLVWLKRRHHSRVRHLLWLATALWRAPMLWTLDRVERDLADRIVYRQFAGMPLDRLDADARRCCAELLLPACFPEAVAEIEMHRRQGRRIVFVSGGLDIVLAPFAEAFGAELIAHRLVVSGGRYTGVHRDFAILGDGTGPRAQGARKAAALHRHADATGIDLRASIGYGDSVNDLPMLEAVGTPIVVRPDRVMRRIARERGWEVRRWGHRVSRRSALTLI
jgi:HAD superfamily hydrolase (TIGR01490 family)